MLSLKSLFIGTFALMVFFLSSFLAEATHDDYYSSHRGYGGYDNYDRGRGNGYGYPYYDFGSFSSNFNRNSRDLDRSTSQDSFLDRTSIFNEQLNSRTFGAAFNVQSTSLNLNDFARSNQRGSSFDTGSISYSVGDGNTPTYRRRLKVDGPRRNDDYTIEESIFGGEQIRYNRNFGNSNSFDTSSGFNRNVLTNDFSANAQVIDDKYARNTQDTQRERNSFSDRLHLQESSFGSGSSIVFNYGY